MDNNKSIQTTIKRDDGKLNFVIEILFNVNTILSIIYGHLVYTYL